MAVGGIIKEITYNHPTLGSGVIFTKSGEESTIDPGGNRSTDDVNLIDGGGEMIDIINPARWFVESTVRWDMNTAKELQKAIDMAGSPVQAEWTFTHINGAVLSGKGKPVGDLSGSSNAQFTLKISGGGTLKQIA